MENNCRMVSMIVPVYNGEQFIERCIASIQKQTYSNIEILIIDDGSTDESLSICNRLAQGDGRISVFSNKHEGVSAARNLGIEKARGTYLFFADADDYIEPDMIRYMVEIKDKEQSEIVVCGWYEETESEKKAKPENQKEIVTLERDEALYSIIRFYHGFCGFMWNKLFPRELIVQNGIKVDTEISIREDLLFCAEVFLRCSQVTFVSKPLYHYVQHDNNTMKKLKIEHTETDHFIRGKRSSIIAQKKLIGLLEGNTEKKNSALIKAGYVYGILGTLYNLYISPVADEEFMREMKVRADDTKSYMKEFLLCRELNGINKLQGLSAMFGPSWANLLHKIFGLMKKSN